MKIARQSKAWVSRPPAAGPTAAPMAAAAAHSDVARPPRAAPASSGSDEHSSSAPPTPCTQRMATRTSRLWATPHPIEARPKSPMPASSARRELSRCASGMKASTPPMRARL